MPNPADLVLDPWTGLSHKAVIGQPGRNVVPQWVGKTNMRRLTAYLVLAAYMRNAARFFLTTTVDDPARWEQHREYGDPAMLVATIRSAVVGDEPRPLVDGSDDELGPPPTLEDVADRVPSSDDTSDSTVTPQDDTGGASASPEQTQALTDATAEWEQRRLDIEAATDRQEWVEQWWTDERAGMKIVESEDDAVGLGDGVYELVISPDKERVRLRVHEPGFYFPVWADDAQGDDYPDVIHLAWQFDDDDGDEFIRRITYERRRLMVFADDGLTPTGFATRRYPYAPDVDSQWTVVKTDATWRIKDLQQRKWGVNSLSLDAAWRVAVDENGDEIRDLDLEIDFIPIVHNPNTPAIKELWGESALTRISQILDDLAAGDTDLAVSSALVASPALVMTGSTGSDRITTYGPGMVFRTPDGNLSVLDTSSSLDALIKMQERLLERLSTVRQVPASVLGRVDLNNQLAGITLLLSFGPFRSYIQNLRLTRVDKYALLLKFVQRLAIVGGWLDGPVLDANLAFGPFLPTDEASVVALIVQLVNAKVISRSTAMRLAQEAGIAIESIEDELDAVRHEDFEGALTLANATGSEQAAADYLGVTVEPAPAQDSTPPANQPAPGEQLPPPPGQPPGGQPPTPLPA